MNPILTRSPKSPVWRLARPLGAVVLALCSVGAAASSNVVISQVYGGGGNAGATLRNDFVEIFNRSSAPVSLAGWSVQYASATGTSWQSTPLPSTLLEPGQYLLVQQAMGTGGTTALPTPDATGTTAMSGTAGKVALANIAEPITSATQAAILDLVAYGPTATPSEGSGPSGAPGNATAALRAANGCTDTDN
ncbi:MAG: lamin tail domain-containing protein, partial [Herminiimonas sp.]|nr:lamin tail domain-containing protein [Herminiimonas sp.]